MKNYLPFAMCLVLVSGTPLFAQRSAVLMAPVKVPLVLDGRAVGEATVPAGTKVKVLKEEEGRVLVVASAGAAWVAASSVEFAATVAGSASGNPVAEESPVAALGGVGAAAAPGKGLERQKRVVVFVGGGIDQHARMLIDCLKANGCEVKLAGLAGRSVMESVVTESLDDRGVPWLSTGYTDTPRYEPDLIVGKTKGDCSYAWKDSMVSDFDAFYFTQPIQEFFSPDLFKELLSSGKIVICASMTSDMANKYAASGQYAESGGDKPPGRLEANGKKIFYYIYGQHKHANKKYKLTDDKAAAEFVKGKLYPAIKNAGL